MDIFLHDRPDFPTSPDLLVRASEMEAMRRRAWEMIADKDREIALLRDRLHGLYKQRAQDAAELLELTIRAEAAEDKLSAVTNGDNQ